MKRTKLLALLGTGALLLGMAISTTSVVYADGQVAWDGKKGTDGNGNLNLVDCDDSNTPYLYWVFVPGGNDQVTAATITFGGTGTGTYDLNQDNGQWKLQDGPWFDLVGLTAVVNYTGDTGSGDVHVTISHGCPGETETTTTTTEETTTTTTEETTTTTTEETTTTTEETTTTTTFTGGTGGETDVPTEPNTATIGSAGPSSPADGTWLLVLALGALLASVVVLTPAKARNRR